MKQEITKGIAHKPIKTFKAGAVSAAIWQNTGQNSQGEEYIYHDVKVCRNYTTDGKNWQSTDTYRLNDLPKVALVTAKAYEYLAMMDRPKDEKQDELI